MDVIALDAHHLGNRGYLVHDGRHGLVVDTPRDIEAAERAAECAGVRIVAVADTHVHNDYLSGGVLLAERHRADYLLSAQEQVAVRRTPVRGHDVLELGRLRVTVLDTPGHTLYHQAFLVTDGDGPGALFSGGSLLNGTVGRTDLVDPLLGRLLGRTQWASARTLAQLPSETTLHPTHGFGGLSAARPGPGTWTPVEPTNLLHELVTNPVLSTPREVYVADLVAAFGPVPGYFERLGSLNRSGGALAAVAHQEKVGVADVTDALEDGEWVVDIRPREEFARAHLPGSVNIEAGPQAASYVAWLLPWGAPLTLVATDDDEIDRLVRQLADVGVAARSRHRLRPVSVWPAVADYPVLDWAGYAKRAAGRGQPYPLDVRWPTEYAESHLQDVRHIPLHELGRRAHSLPGETLYVHCRSGFRAAIGASLLARSGHDVVLVTDDWERARELGIRTVSASRAA